MTSKRTIRTHVPAFLILGLSFMSDLVFGQGGYYGIPRYDYGINNKGSISRLVTTQSVPCRPDFYPTLTFPGICSTVDDLETMCTDREVSVASRDCAMFDANYCCYFSPSQGNSLGPPISHLVKDIDRPPRRPMQPAPSLQAVESVPVEIIPTTTTTTTTTTTSPTTQQIKIIPPAPAVIVSAPVVPVLNQACQTPNDCPDAGTTCFRGRCTCWTEQGFSAARTWACNEDRSCEIMFPGHVCRQTQLCQLIAGNRGYCQPTGSIRM